MMDRTTLLGLAVAGLCLTAPTARSWAAAPAVRLASLTTTVAPDDDDDDDKKGPEKGEPKKKGGDDDDDGKGERKGRGNKDEKEKGEKKEIEQAVPMAMVPAAVLDAVKKEVPGGTITEAELEAKRGKIMYSFDVTSGEMAYDVKITVDGKFYSKKVEDKDEDDEKDEKPAMSQKK